MFVASGAFFVAEWDDESWTWQRVSGFMSSARVFAVLRDYQGRAPRRAEQVAK